MLGFCDLLLAGLKTLIYLIETFGLINCINKQKQCLTIYTRDVNFLGPGRFRTSTDNGDKQICYYNRNKTDTSFNSVLAMREQSSQANDIKSSIVQVIDNINKSNIYSKVTNELNSFKDDFSGGTVQSISGGSITGREKTDSSRRRKYINKRNNKKQRFPSRK